MDFRDNIMPCGKPLAVALSGGVDSLALTYMLAERGYSITALHVHHGLREEADAHAHQLVAWMAQHNIDCHILRIEQDLRAARNVQQAAREARYSLMTQWCHAHHMRYLCMAHHSDDQLETLLMRLARGSGIDGLAGMRPVCERDGITLLRPLLHTAKHSLITYMQARGAAWLEDASNASDIYTRNRVRRMLPMLAKEGITPQRSADVMAHCARAASCLELLAQQWCDTHISRDHDHIMMPVSAYAALHEELALRVMRRCLERYGHDKALRFAKLAPLVAALRSASSHMQSLHGCDILKQDGRIILTPRNPLHNATHATGE